MKNPYLRERSNVVSTNNSIVSLKRIFSYYPEREKGSMQEVIRLVRDKHSNDNDSFLCWKSELLADKLRLEANS